MKIVLYLDIRCITYQLSLAAFFYAFSYIKKINIAENESFSTIIDILLHTKKLHNME